MRKVEDLLGWLSSRGGIARTADAIAAGFTPHAMRSAVDRGSVERVRRSWLAVPGCAPDLRRAAAAGGRLTCLTQARRLGLWTPEHAELHLAVASTASRIAADGVRLHWSQGPSPVGVGVLEDPIVNVLSHVARCVAVDEALPVWESAIRRKLVAAEVLERVEWKSTPARRLADMASTQSDSGIETRFLLLMRSIGVAVRQQVWIDGHPVDGLIGECLAVQLDGFEHHRAKDRRRDLRADARLVLRGYSVLRFDYVQVMFQPDSVIAIISAAIAQGQHRRHGGRRRA
ncbi:MAG: type IV toxin-antitoxin system AbiEi family antitoxin domain-containing protein [Microbacterium pygmaeum]